MVTISKLIICVAISHVVQRNKIGAVLEKRGIVREMGDSGILRWVALLLDVQ